MAGGFEDPQPDHHQTGGKVTVAIVSGDQAEVPMGAPFQPLMLEPLTTDFSFWRIDTILDRVLIIPMKPTELHFIPSRERLRSHWGRVLDSILVLYYYHQICF